MDKYFYLQLIYLSCIHSNCDYVYFNRFYKHIKTTSLKHKVFFREKRILGVPSFMFMISTYVESYCIFSLSSFPTKRAGVSDRRILEMFWLNVTECLVPAWCSKLAQSTGEHFPVRIFQYQGHYLLLPRSYEVWKLLLWLLSFLWSEICFIWRKGSFELVKY